jgi:hypothetical protein
MSENNEKHFPTFLWMVAGEAQILVNLEQVRTVDEISEGHCRLTFSSDHTYTLTGEGADTLVAQIVAHGVTIEGSPVMDVWKKLGEQP